MTGHLLSAITLDRIWLILGFAGQALFASRFLVQWFRSEMEGRSVVPLAFWYFSIAGGLVSLVYAIHIGSAPFAVGQGSGLLVYARNLYLIYRERAALKRVEWLAHYDVVTGLPNRALLADRFAQPFVARLRLLEAGLIRHVVRHPQAPPLGSRRTTSSERRGYGLSRRSPR